MPDISRNRIKANQIEEDIQRKIQTNSNVNSEGGKTNCNLQLSNLHTNNKLIEATDDLKIRYRLKQRPQLHDTVLISERHQILVFKSAFRT